MAINFIGKRCAPCEGGTLPLTPREIAEYQKVLKTPWEVVEEKRIRREFKFNDFRGAMEFANKVAELAEAEGHHPDLHIFYGKVIIELSTHAIGGLSENDFILAAKSELLV